MPTKKLIHIIGGGTMAPVRPHFSLCAPAYGGTARWLYEACRFDPSRMTDGVYEPVLHLTRMADASSRLETNKDIAELISDIVENPASKIVFLTAALCDWDPFLLQTLDIPSLSFTATTVHAPQPGATHLVGAHLRRLKTAEFQTAGLGVMVKPAEKVINEIRRYRKDIFLVGCKTTTGATADEQFMAGLGLLKGASCNLVLANDIKTRLNMIVTPEEARYASTENREEVLRELYEMTMARSKLTFTRSKVVNRPLIEWGDPRIPDSLRTVVNHCIKKGAYKPFNGKTVGHFAFNLPGPGFVTSIRKSDFNKLSETGMVYACPSSPDEVEAYGAKPSVGGQSQRIIFKEHPELDCIVHFHCPLKEGVEVSTRSQKFFECGSHECGQNTSDGLKDYNGLKAVMLDKHGPNIVFNKNMDPNTVIDFIESHWDLHRSTRE